MKAQQQTSNDVRRRYRVARIATITALISTVPVFAHPNPFPLFRLSGTSKGSLPTTGGGTRTDCNDGDPCTIDSFDEGTSECVHTPRDCDDSDPCTIDSCDPQNGDCLHTPLNCDDGNPCTSDSCDPQTGLCNHIPVNCDDGNLCTNDTCDQQTGQCTFTPVNCDDGNPCTIDACDAQNGQCLHTPQDCNDSDPCTTDSCNCGSCTHDNDDDDDGVTNCNDQCANTASGAAVNAQGCSCGQQTCDDGNLCSTDSCNSETAQCVHTPQNCDDSDSCTTDSCVGGSCVHDNDDDDDGVTNCNDQCASTPNGAAVNAQGCSCAQQSCDDGNPCTTDSCDSQTAQCVHTPQNCDDSDPCTTDSCNGGTCSHDSDDDDDGVTNCNDQCPSTPNGAAVNAQGCSCGQLSCADSDPCTVDTCDAQTVQCVHTPQNCDDSDPCTTDSCNGGSCVHDNDDDDDGVTNCNDQCPSTPNGAAVNAQGCSCGQLSCADIDPCTVDTCDAQTVQCVHTPQNCDDGVPCTDDSCDPQTGQCVHTPVNCDDANPCTIDSCDPQTGQCLHTPIACDDSDPCTVDSCDPQTGQCVHAPRDCSDGEPCTLDACDPQTGLCVHTPVNCDDANPCTIDSCDPQTGQCLHTPNDCNDGNVGTIDSCNPLTGECIHTPVNVLFMICDDLNDAVGYLGTRPGIQTPNIDALAARGVWFTNASANAPLCNASRASFLAGLRPSTRGIYTNNDPWRYAVRDRTLMPEYFRAHGYRTLGVGGKITHLPDYALWSETYECGKDPQPATIPAHGIAGLGYIDWAPLNVSDDQMGDARGAAHAADFLSESHSQPFFLAVGFGKPHFPLYVPQSYFDMYPLEDIVLPTINENDLLDMPPAGQSLSTQSGVFNIIRSNNAWRDAVRAYYAAVTFADAQIGVVLEALNNGPNADNTLIVFMSDHGFHLGEKLVWGKYTLWKESCRVPLIIAGPGVSAINQPCPRAVSLLDLYPTLVELTGLPPVAGLEGTSLVPLLADPGANVDHPAITTLGQNRHSIRTDRWRLIRHADGSTELYDLDVDLQEWTNLANDPAHANIKAELIARLPTINTPPTGASPRTLYVKADATGNGDGRSWANALTDLGKALAIANATTWFPPPLVVKEIWVAEGTYRPDAAGGDREKTFMIYRGISMYGGFAGTETSRDQRQPLAHPTILSGDLNGDDGPGQTNRSDNSYHIINATNALRDSVIDGFRITGGNANNAPRHNRGGALYLDHALPTVLNCTFVDNHADYGGALFNNGGNNSITEPLLFNCVFAGNSANVKGGAIYSQSDYLNPINCYFGTFGYTKPKLVNCTIVGNSAPIGGGLSADSYCNSYLYNCILWGNTDANGNSHFAQLVGGYMYTRYTCVQNYVTTPQTGPNNIGGNPLFVDQLGPDGLLFTGDEDLRLQSGSACIDAGNNADVPPDTMDLDQDLNTWEPIGVDGSGANRFEDDPQTLNVNNAPPPVVDIGAFEYVVSEVCFIGDANRDGAVDGLDIQVLADCAVNGFSSLADCDCADFDHDQVTSMADIETYLETVFPDPEP